MATIFDGIHTYDLEVLAVAVETAVQGGADADLDDELAAWEHPASEAARTLSADCGISWEFQGWGDTLRMIRDELRDRVELEAEAAAERAHEGEPPTTERERYESAWAERRTNG